jgi:Stage II sporulation protein E (SpoIIE)
LLATPPDQNAPARKFGLFGDPILLFFTDGLIERPGQLIDEGLDRPRRAVAAEPPEAACAAAMGALVGSEPSRDDVTLLMIRFGRFRPCRKRPTPMPDAAFPSGVRDTAAAQHMGHDVGCWICCPPLFPRVAG